MMSQSVTWAEAEAALLKEFEADGIQRSVDELSGAVAYAIFPKGLSPYGVRVRRMKLGRPLPEEDGSKVVEAATALRKWKQDNER